LPGVNYETLSRRQFSPPQHHRGAALSRYAADQPIFDYHCHLPVADIADNKKFANLTAIWLAGDHYKWRAMRANGIDEELITGSASDRDKFHAWARTVPKTLRNPLYHWTHLELKKPFGITGPPCCRRPPPIPSMNAVPPCSRRMGFPPAAILERMRVKVVCTTDDPLDSLEHHRRLAADKDFTVKVLPAFRPDKAMAVDDPAAFNRWVDRLAK
jgi:glucuronate isomerase